MDGYPAHHSKDDAAPITTESRSNCGDEVLRIVTRPPRSTRPWSMQTGSVKHDPSRRPGHHSMSSSDALEVFRVRWTISPLLICTTTSPIV